MRVCTRCCELYPDDGLFCPMDGGALSLVTDPLIGKTIAQRYRIISRLGGGGMSTVYLAKHVMIDRLSAIKILHGELSGSENQRDRFLREARAVNRINHENIVEITDFGEWDDLIFLVMEYIPGEPLHKLLAGGALPWQRAACVGVQVAAALARAHQMGVVHRDVKPANIMIVRRAAGEVAMLTDFGIAKILDAPSLTLTAQIFGTPGYIAPEYIEGAAADTRTDLYALGVVLYESITGRLPHDESGTTPLMLQVLRNPPKPLSEHGVKLSKPFEALVMRLLSRRPEQRARDAFDVYDQLAAILSDEGIFTAGSLFLGGAVKARAKALEAESERERDSSRPFAHLSPMCAGGLARIEEAVARQPAPPPRVALLLQQARSLSTDVAVASHAVSVDQARIAELERYCRTLRTSIGRALDDLSRDLSRVEGKRDEVAMRRQAAAARTSALGAVATLPSLSSGGLDMTVWEQAVLAEEETRMGALGEDLAGQVQALRDHLAVQNESLDRKLASARYALEGRVAALRRLAAEAWYAIEEVGAALGTQPFPADTMPGRPPLSIR
jgi:eukaryotic-like serine/threonine-protein kinase